MRLANNSHIQCCHFFLFWLRTVIGGILYFRRAYFRRSFDSCFCQKVRPLYIFCLTFSALHGFTNICVLIDFTFNISTLHSSFHSQLFLHLLHKQFIDHAVPSWYFHRCKNWTAHCVGRKFTFPFRSSSFFALTSHLLCAFSAFLLFNAWIDITTFSNM